MIANTYLAKGVHRSSSFLMVFHQVACAKRVQILIKLQGTCLFVKGDGATSRPPYEYPLYGSLITKAYYLSLTINVSKHFINYSESFTINPFRELKTLVPESYIVPVPFISGQYLPP